MITYIKKQVKIFDTSDKVNTSILKEICLFRKFEILHPQLNRSI